MKTKKLLLSIFAILGISVFGVMSANATTWYVRDGGGTNAQCTGTTNSIYPGSGTHQPCAFNHPVWALGVPIYATNPGKPANSSTPGTMVAGDTLYIIGDSDVSPGTQAHYMIGLGMPNSNDPAQCSATYPTSCFMAQVPAGSNSSNLTKIIGIGTHQPQLWGTAGTIFVLDLTGGNYDIENLEITQHSSCSGVHLGSNNSGQGGFPAYCGAVGQGYWARTGIEMEGSNITTKNLWVHNLSNDLVDFPGTVTNWNSTNDKFIAAGFFLTQSFTGNEAFAGNNTMTNDIWAFGGCMEKYPLPDPNNVKDLNNYVDCIGQEFDGYGGLGGGFMQQATTEPCGNWTISYSQFLFNLKTNIDLLHCDGTGTFNFYRSRSEGSSGEALKVNMGQVNIEESQLIGNAPVWSTAPFQAILAPYDTNNSPLSSYFPGNFEMCRGGNAINFQINNGEQINFINDDLVSNCTTIIGIGQLYSFNGCTGSSVNVYNTKFLGGWSYGDPDNENVDLFYNGGTDGNGSGACGTGNIPFNEYNDSCYDVNSYAGISCSSGSNTISTDPLILGEQTTPLKNLLGPTAYYSGTSLGDLLYLQSSSPLKGAGTTNITFTNGSSNDYNGIPQNSPPDIGAIQYNSCIGANNFCSISGECCGGGTCSAEGQCSGGSVTLGDVTGSGQVTVNDAELTAQYSVGMTVANFNPTAAMVDGNSKVDIYDAYLIAEYALGIINKFPVQA